MVFDEEEPERDDLKQGISSVDALANLGVTITYASAEGEGQADDEEDLRPGGLAAGHLHQRRQEDRDVAQHRHYAAGLGAADPAPPPHLRLRFVVALPLALGRRRRRRLGRPRELLVEAGDAGEAVHHDGLGQAALLHRLEEAAVDVADDSQDLKSDGNYVFTLNSPGD